MTWAPDYCTTIELEDFVRIPDTNDTVQVSLAIAAASRAIDRACNRQFGKADTPQARYYSAVWDSQRRRWMVCIDDLMDDTGLTVAVDSRFDGSYGYEATGHVLTPRNAAANGRPWTCLDLAPGTPSSGPEGVEVTALFGWSAVPDAIKQATLLQASRFLARRDAPFGVAGSPDTGSEMRLLAKVDPDVEVAVAAYKRWWAAA